MDVNFFRALAVIALSVITAPRVWAAEPADDRYAAAAGHYGQGRWKMALEEFRTFLVEHPQHAKAEQAQFYVGESLVQMRQFAEAAGEFQKLIAAEPEKDLARKALFRAGESSYLAGQLDDARRELQRFRELYAEDHLIAYVLPYLGDVSLEQDDSPAAEALFAEALERFPNGALQDECRFGLARSKEAQGQREAAERIFLALASKPGSDWADDAQFRLGSSQLAAGDYAAALATFGAFETTLATSAWKSHARLGRAQSLHHSGKHAESRRLLEELAAHEVLGLEARYWKGLSFEAEANYTDAAATLLPASTDAERAQHPLAAAIVLHAAEALLHADQAAKAAAQFARLLKIWPESDLADDACLGQTRAALAEHNHKQVDALAAEFSKRFSKSELAPLLEQTHARSLLARGDFAAAEKLLTLLVEKDAERSLAHRNLLGVALEGQAKHDAVLTVIEPVLVSKDPQQRADALRLQASALVALGRFGEAVKPLEKWLEQGTAHRVARDVSQAQAQLVLCYARSKNLDAARKAHGVLVEKHAHDDVVFAATAALAEAALAAGRREWAQELFQSLASENASKEFAPKGLAGLAWAQFQAGDLDDSAATWLKLLDKFPDDPLAGEAAFVRGQILEQQQRLDAAAEMYRRVIDRHATSPRLAAALLGAARLEDRLKHHEAAAKLYERLAKEFPKLPERDVVLYNRGWVLRELGQTADAGRQFEELNAKYPQSRYWPDTVYRLAERALKSGDRQRARKLLDELLASQLPGEIRAHALYLSAQVAIAEESWDAAMKPLDQLAREFPTSPLRSMAEFWRAEAAYRHADYRDAAKRFAALAKQPAETNEAWRAMVPLRQAQLLAQQKKWEDARTLAARIATDFPNFEQQYEADFVIGRSLAGQGKFDDAREWYRKAIRSPQGAKTETAATAQWMIGESYFHQKNYEAAVREFLRLEILYAFPKWQAAALLEAGKCHEFLGEWPQAVELYARLLKTYPRESFAEEASRRLQTAREHSATK